MKLRLGLSVASSSESLPALSALSDLPDLYLALLAGAEDTTEAAAGTVSGDLATWTQSNLTFGASATPATATESTDGAAVLHRAYVSSSGLEVGALTLARFRVTGLDASRHLSTRVASNYVFWNNDTGGINSTTGSPIATEIDQNDRDADLRFYVAATAATDLVSFRAREVAAAINAYVGDGRDVADVEMIDVTQERVTTWGNDPTLGGPDAAQVTSGSMPLVVGDFQGGRTVYRFDGTDDRVDFAADIFYSGTGCTLPLVFRAGSTATGTILSSDSASAPSVALAGNRLRVSLGVANYGEIVFADTRGFHAVIVRYDGSGSTNAERLRIWLDGVEWTMSYTGTIPASFTAPTSVRVGDNQTPDDPFYGFLGEFDVYSRAQSVVDVGRLATFVANRWGLPRYSSRAIVMPAGQSNAVGGGVDWDKGAYPYLYTEGGSRAVDWSSVQPYTNGTHGCEIEICRALAARGVQPVIVKYAVNGSSLASDWDPDGTGNDYDNAVAFWLARLAELNADPSELRGIPWWQGETDSNSETWANAYATNLAGLFSSLRSDLSAKSLRGVIVLLNPDADNGAYEDTVRSQQQSAVAADSLLSSFDAQTLGYPANDGVHYDGAQQDAAGTVIAALL